MREILHDRKTLKRVFGAVAGAALVLALALVQPFPGLEAQGTVALAILLGAVLWWIFGVLPEYATALLMAGLFVVVVGIPADVVFDTFSSSIWWLLVCAFCLGLGMQRSGLMKRMALGILKVFPRTFRAQAAGLMAASMLTGPFIPSLSAKATMLTPLAMAVSDGMGYQRKGHQANGLFLAMFTGVRNIAPAVISASIIGYAILALLPAETIQRFDMVHWFLAALPWLVVVTLLNYVVLVALYEPRDERAARKAHRVARRAGEWGEDPNEGPNARSNKSSTEGGEDRLAHADSVSASAARAASAEPASASVRVASAEPAKPALHEDLGPMSTAEKRMLAIAVTTVGLWVFEPLHGIPAYAVALFAVVVMIACGELSRRDFREGIAWDTLIFIGVVLGLSPVFVHTGIDTWIVGLCEPLFEALVSNPYALVLGIGAMTVALRFVIVSETAFVNIFMAFMVPLAMQFGVNTWIVGFSVYAMVNPWFAAYQNAVYIAALGSVDSQMTSHPDLAKYCLIYVLICALGLVASVPYWQWMGLL